LSNIACGALALAFTLCATRSVDALDAGQATGSATIDGTTTSLAFAVRTRKENLFDDKKQDLVFVITDHPLGATRPDDDVELSVRAHRGELVGLALRIDSGRLVNVTISYKGLSGLVILPGSWFQYRAARTSATLKLATREHEGHSYAVDVEFMAAPYTAPRPAAGAP
jgi:hypothetical protein